MRPNAEPACVCSMSISHLYREMLRTASSIKDVNFREYFLRIVKDDFRKTHTSDFIAMQTRNLEMLKRQSLVQNMYFSNSFATKR